MADSAALPFLGAGLSFRDAWRWEVVRHRDELGAVECIPDDVAGPAGLRELVLISQAVPVLLHGIGLSLGSSEGLDPRRLGEHRLHSEPARVGDDRGRVPEESWTLLEWLAPRTDVRAVILERDDDLPPFEELMAEVRRAGEVLHEPR